MAKKNPRQPNNSAKARRSALAKVEKRYLQFMDRTERQKADPDYEFTSEDIKILFEDLEFLKNQAEELAYGFLQIEEALKKRILEQSSELGIE